MAPPRVDGDGRRTPSFWQHLPPSDRPDVDAVEPAAEADDAVHDSPDAGAPPTEGGRADTPDAPGGGPTLETSQTALASTQFSAGYAAYQLQTQFDAQDSDTPSVSDGPADVAPFSADPEGLAPIVYGEGPAGADPSDIVPAAPASEAPVDPDRADAIRDWVEVETAPGSAVLGEEPQRIVAALNGESELGALSDAERDLVLDETIATWQDPPGGGTFHRTELQLLAFYGSEHPEHREALVHAFARASAEATEDGDPWEAAQLSVDAVIATAGDPEDLRTAIDSMPPELAGNLSAALGHDTASNVEEFGYRQVEIIRALAVDAPTTEASAAALNGAFLTVPPGTLRDLDAQGALATALTDHWYPDDPERAASEAERLEDILHTRQGREYLLNPNVSPLERLENLGRVAENEDWDAELFEARDSVYDNPDILFEAAFPTLAQYREALGDDPQAYAGTDLENAIGVAMGEPPSFDSTLTEAEQRDFEEAIGAGQQSMFVELPELSEADRERMTAEEIEAYEFSREISEGTQERVDLVAERIREVGGDTPEVTAMPIFYSHESTGTVQFSLFRVVDEEDPSVERFVDHQGRIYEDFDHWKTTNKLPPGSVVFPTDGHVGNELTRRNTPETPDTFRERAEQVINTASLVGGVVAGGILIAGSGGLATPVVVGAGTVVAGAGAWQAYRGYETIQDRRAHGESISLADPAARAAWLDVGAGAATVLSLGATGVAGRLAGPVVQGAATAPGAANSARAAAAASRYLGFTAGTLDAAAAANAGAYLVENFDELTGAERLAALGEIGFWGVGAGVSLRGPGRFRAPADGTTTGGPNGTVSPGAATVAGTPWLGGRSPDNPGGIPTGLSPEELARFSEVDIAGQRFVDAEHYAAAVAAGDRPEFAYGQTEFEAWQAAEAQIMALAADGVPLTPELLQGIHATAAAPIHGAQPGMLRSETGVQNFPGGAMGVKTAAELAELRAAPGLIIEAQPLPNGQFAVSATYPPPDVIDEGLEEILDDLNAALDDPSVDPVIAAADAQRALIGLHPFNDGNGRVSRLVLDYALARRGIPPPILSDPNLDFGPADIWRQEVYDGIERAVAQS